MSPEQIRGIEECLERDQSRRFGNDFERYRQNAKTLDDCARKGFPESEASGLIVHGPGRGKRLTIRGQWENAPNNTKPNTKL